MSNLVLNSHAQVCIISWETKRCDQIRICNNCECFNFFYSSTLLMSSIMVCLFWWYSELHVTPNTASTKIPSLFERILLFLCKLKSNKEPICWILFYDQIGCKTKSSTLKSFERLPREESDDWERGWGEANNRKVISEGEE